MILIVEFSLGGDKKEIYWYEDLLKFPKVITYQGSCYEWIAYSLDSGGSAATLLFGNVSIHAYPFPVPSFEGLFVDRTERITPNECTCGAKYDREFPDNHLQMCKLWSFKW